MVVRRPADLEWLVDFPDNGIHLYAGNDVLLLKSFPSKGWLLQDG